MNDNLTFAIDKNLEFFIDNSDWVKFFSKYGIRPSFYTDMKKLTEDMGKNKILLSYLPTANFFYLRKDTFYIPIASALFNANNTTKISSLLIVEKNSPFRELPDLKGKTYGYIHPYCTSSYFAPALLLHKNHYSIHNFFSSMMEVGAWQLQIDAVIARKVDATMIQEDVWYKLPSNAEKTKIIGRQDNLPSPVILCSKSINQELLKDLKDLLHNYRVQLPKHSLFNGFTNFQKEQVESFFTSASEAFAQN